MEAEIETIMQINFFLTEKKQNEKLTLYTPSLICLSVGKLRQYVPKSIITMFIGKKALGKGKSITARRQYMITDNR